MDNSNVEITAAVIAFNSADYIEDCLASLKKAGLEEESLMVVDDGSTDGTPELVRDRFPLATVVSLGGNFGHSRACNEALRKATTEWVVLIDHDTVAHEDWLRELRAAIARHPGAGIVVSRAVFENDRQTIHSDGGYAHFVGNMILRNGFRQLSEADNEEAELGAAGTTSMAVNRQKAVEAGLFDEDFFIYLNDFEFSLRMRLAGYCIYCAPGSIIYHKGGSQGFSFRGKGGYPAKRAYFILRNRWFLLLKLYSVKTLLLCLPPLLVYELVLLAMSVKKRVVAEHLRALLWIAGNLPVVIRARARTQRGRKLSDLELLEAGEMTFVPGLVRGKPAQTAKKVLDGFFSLYWRGIRGFL